MVIDGASELTSIQQTAKDSGVSVLSEDPEGPGRQDLVLEADVNR